MSTNQVLASDNLVYVTRGVHAMSARALEEAVTIAAADFGCAIKSVIDHGMSQWAVTAITGDLVGMAGHGDDFRLFGHVYALVTLYGYNHEECLTLFQALKCDKPSD